MPVRTHAFGASPTCMHAPLSQKRKGCQDDSPGVVWKRWRLPSKSHLKTRAVNLATFPFQYMVWVQLVALSFFSPENGFKYSILLTSLMFSVWKTILSSIGKNFYVDMPRPWSSFGRPLFSATEISTKFSSLRYRKYFGNTHAVTLQSMKKVANVPFPFHCFYSFTINNAW